MGSQLSSGNQELVSLTSLLRAKYAQHLALRHNNNNLVIRSNYNKTNPSPKTEQEVIHVSKIIARKIIEIHKVNASLRQFKARNNLRRNSKFLNVLHVDPRESFHQFHKSLEDPESLISDEVNNVSNLNQHFQSLLSYLNYLKDRCVENSRIIEDNAKKALTLSKARNELTDLKHYKNYLQASKQFLGDKKTIKFNERKIFVRSNSMKFSNKLFLLKKSREVVEEYVEKVRVLKERTDSKLENLMKKHEKVVGNIRTSPGDLSPSFDLQRKLAALVKKEEFLKEKVMFWKRQRGLLDTSESTTGEYLSKEESIKRDADKSEDSCKAFSKKRTDDFESEWAKYNMKYNSSMEFFNQITSKRDQVTTK
jgi:hypothetical protein